MSCKHCFEFPFPNHPDLRIHELERTVLNLPRLEISLGMMAMRTEVGFRKMSHPEHDSPRHQVPANIVHSWFELFIPHLSGACRTPGADVEPSILYVDSIIPMSMPRANIAPHSGSGEILTLLLGNVSQSSILRSRCSASMMEPIFLLLVPLLCTMI